MAGFTSLANVFIAQLCNFLSLKANGLYVVRLIMYKPELEKTQNLSQKDKDIHLYIAKYAHDLVSKKMLSIRKSQSLQLESSQLSLQKIFTFFFCNIDNISEPEPTWDKIKKDITT